MKYLVLGVCLLLALGCSRPEPDVRGLVAVQIAWATMEKAEAQSGNPACDCDGCDCDPCLCPVKAPESPQEATKVPEATPEPPKPRKAAQAKYGPLGASSPEWTWPGDIYSHLRSTHGVSPEGLSHREAVVLHNRLHNAQAPARAQPVYRVQSSCPGGVCPLPTRVQPRPRTGLFGRLRR